MKLIGKVEAYKTARQTLVDNIATNYAKELFGTPPSTTPSGKLQGGTPPNMTLIEKLYK